MTLTLPWPPSINGYWRAFRNRQIISKKGRAYRECVCARFPRGSTLKGDLEATITLHPPDRRRRDWDNWHKSAFDALTHAGVLGDDSQIRRAVVEFGEIRKPGEYVVTLKPLGAKWQAITT